MQSPVHTFPKPSQVHLQTGTGVSNSIAGMQCLANQDAAALGPCVPAGTQTTLLLPRSHIMRCRRSVWVTELETENVLCHCCPAAPAVSQPHKAILPKPCTPGSSALTPLQLLNPLSLSNKPLGSWSWIPSFNFYNSHFRTVQSILASTLTPTWHSVQ